MTADHLDETTAARLIAGELPADVAERARAHAATCRDCERFVAELARVNVETREDTGPAGGGDVELRRGTTVGRFLVLGRIGSGGMGVVYGAYDPELDRRVALKVLRDAVARGGTGGRARLVREAQAAARLSHANVVSVFDIGTFADHVYIAMEHVDGVTLTEWLRGDRSWSEVVDVFVQAGRGLAAAHDAGVIHRDFKPDNVLVGRDGRVRVLDFGLARAAGTSSSDAGARSPPPPPSSSSPSSPSIDLDATQPASTSADVRLTTTGMLLGTPRYMAPEQFTGGDITPGTDQFAFCVALYQALYRRAPFAGDRLPSIADHVLAGDLEPPADARGPAELRRVITRGLAVEPARRHPAMTALLGELERARRSPRRRRVIAVAAAAAVVVGGGGFAIALATRAQPEAPCAGAGSAVRTAWNAERAARGAAAFAAQHLAFGEAAWRGVETRLDAYAGAWAQMRVEACEATHVHREQSEQLLDLRVACLDDRLAELAALVDALDHADAATVRRGVEAADRLPAIAACADRVALTAPVRPPDLARASQVRAVIDQLAPAAALDRLGKPREALAAARRACATADTLAYAPLLARCRRTLATLADGVTGDAAGAADRLTEAVAAAVTGNDLAQTVDAAIALARMLGDRLGRFDEAERWLTLADGAAVRLADPRDAGARIASVRGLIATRRGRYGDALARFEQVLAARERLDPDAPATAQARISVGHALVALGRYAEAAPQYQKALAVLEASAGAAHPDLMPVLDGLGQLEWSRGKPADGVPYLERSLAITRTVVEPGHPSLIVALANLGSVLTSAGELDRALAYLEEARTAVRPADRRELGLVLTNLVVVYQERGDHERALATAREALAVERAAKGDDHVDVGRAHFNVGDTLLSAARPREAVAELRAALAIWQRALPADHPLIATGQTALADALLQTGDARGAIPLLDQAAAAIAARGDAGELARTRFVLARATWPTDHARGAALARAARDAADATLRGAIAKWLAAHP